MVELLSICLTVRNRSLNSVGGKELQLLPKCIDSIREAVRAAAVRAEIVVTDWSSDDWPLLEWLVERAAPIPVRIVQAKGRFSRGSGRNQAADAATGDVLFFIDADMIVSPQVLTRGLGVVRSGRSYFPICFSFNDPQHRTGSWRHSGDGNCAVARRHFGKVRWPEYETWGKEDGDFRSRLKGFSECVREEVAGFFHQWHPSSLEWKDRYAPRPVPQIKNLEMHVAHVCNLACEGCSHFSGNGHRGIVSLEECIRWMAHWNTRLRPENFRILGGEPTINPELCAIIRAVGHAWPDSQLFFTTNAFFIHRHPGLGAALAEAKVSGVKISIHSDQPEFMTKVLANIETMREWGRQFRFEVNVNDAHKSWSRVYFGTGKDVTPYQLGNQRQSWEACLTKPYPQLLNGIIYKCPLTAYIKVQHAVHGTDPAWKLALDYPGLPPGCSDADLESFFQREDEPVCALCPTAYHHFTKPSPLRSARTTGTSIAANNYGMQFAVVLAIAVVFLAWSHKSTAEAPDWIPCGEYLWNLGKASGFYFTIEHYGDIGLPVITSRHTADNKIGMERSSLIQQLNMDLPSFTIATNRWLSNVIHLTQINTNNQDASPLLMRATITYRGSLTGYVVVDQHGHASSNGIGLIQMLSQRVPGIELSRGGDWRESWIVDKITTVSVNATNELARDIITRCLPVNQYRPILWRAIRMRRGEGYVTEIKCYGQLDPSVRAPRLNE